MEIILKKQFTCRAGGRPALAADAAGSTYSSQKYGRPDETVAPVIRVTRYVKMSRCYARLATVQEDGTATLA